MQLSLCTDYIEIILCDRVGREGILLLDVEFEFRNLFFKCLYNTRAGGISSSKAWLAMI